MCLSIQSTLPTPQERVVCVDTARKPTARVKPALSVNSAVIPRTLTGMLRSTFQGHPSWCLLWVLRDGGIIAVSVKGYCKPRAFMRGFMTIPSPLNVQLSTSSSGLPNSPFKSQKNQQTCILMVPPHTGGHNLHDNEEAGTATSYSRGKWGPCGTLSGGQVSPGSYNDR